jgi:hypothetical protein
LAAGLITDRKKSMRSLSKATFSLPKVLRCLLFSCFLFPLVHADNVGTGADPKAGGMPRGDLLGLLHDNKLTECMSIGPWTGLKGQYLPLTPYPGKENSVACGLSFSVDPTKGNFLVILMTPPEGSLLYGPILDDTGACLFPKGQGVQFTPSSDSLKNLKALDSAFQSNTLLFAIPLTASTKEYKVGFFFQGIATVMTSPKVLAGAFYLNLPQGTAANRINIDDSLASFASSFSTNTGDSSQSDAITASAKIDPSAAVDQFKKLKDDHDQERISDTTFERKWAKALDGVLSVSSTTKESSTIDESAAVDRFQLLKALHDQKLTSDEEYNVQRSEVIRRCFPERSFPIDESLADGDFETQQLAKLKDLHDKNLIDDDEYNLKRGEF